MRGYMSVYLDHTRVADAMSVTGTVTRIQDSETMASARKEIRRKESQDHVNRNLTLMIISIGILFFLGNAPNSISFIFLQIPSIFNTTFMNIYIVFSNVILFTTQSSDIFIYFKFNKKYKSILMRILRCGR